MLIVSNYATVFAVFHNVRRAPAEQYAGRSIARAIKECALSSPLIELCIE